MKAEEWCLEFCIRAAVSQIKFYTFKVFSRVAACLLFTISTVKSVITLQ